MTKHTILFLAANPSQTDRLALDQEARSIQVELERSRWRDCFEFVTRWAAEPLDVIRELRNLRPTVVHFSGHGGLAPAADLDRHVGRRDIVGHVASAEATASPGLYFHGTDGSPRVVSPAALRDAFGAAGTSVKLAVLSACYSEAGAHALLAHVDCVIGTTGSIRDDVARSFAIGFYGGLGARESVAAAYKGGCAAIGLDGLPEGDRPLLRARGAIDPDAVILADLSPITPSPMASDRTATPGFLVTTKWTRKASIRALPGAALISIAFAVAYRSVIGYVPTKCATTTLFVLSYLLLWATTKLVGTIWRSQK